MIGTITAVGVGASRDLLSNEIPLVLTKEFHATAVIIESFIFFLLRYEGN